MKGHDMEEETKVAEEQTAEKNGEKRKKKIRAAEAPLDTASVDCVSEYSHILDFR